MQIDRWRTRALERFDALLDDVANEWTAREEQARRIDQEAARDHLAEWLNQGVRRLRQAGSVGEAVSLAVELAGSYSERCGMFLFRDDGRAEAESLRALGELPLSFSPDDAAAFRAAVETKDPVVALGTPGEVSQELAERLVGESPERVFLFPLSVRSGVKGILFATGNAQPAVLELIAGITALQLESSSLPPPTKRGDLIGITGMAAVAGVSASGASESRQIRRAWKELSPDDQALHLRAQRVARRAVAELRLSYPDAVREGILKSDLYSELRSPIDKAREEFRRDFIAASPTMVDYFYLELVRGLAEDRDQLLGPGFPGALV